MDPEERKALAEAVALAIASAPRPLPSATESIQRTVAIFGGILGVLGVLVAAIGWAFQLQATVASVGSDVSETRASVAELTRSTNAMAVDRWTRTDHDQFVQSTVAALELRIRALETRAGP